MKAVPDSLVDRVVVCILHDDDWLNTVDERVRIEVEAIIDSATSMPTLHQGLVARLDPTKPYRI